MKVHPDQMGHHRPFVPDRPYDLTIPACMLRVLPLAAQGLGNKEIGLRLHITEKTVKNYMWELNQFFHTASRTATVIEAMRRGVIPCPHHCLVGHPPQRKPRPRRR